MTAGRSYRQPVRIRRRGRHASPSQVEKVALQAGKAAPAVAIAGVLVAAPSAQHALAASAVPFTATAHGQTVGGAVSDQAKGLLSPTGQDATRLTTHTATLDAYGTRSVTVASSDRAAPRAGAAASTRYTVRSGDSLSTIAERYYHNRGDWQYLYQANAGKVANPDDIYPGEKIVIPDSAPARSTATHYVPRHARPGSVTTTARVKQGSANGGSADVITQSAAQGMYSCSALERLWEQAGGNANDAFRAAEIATAESGGNPNAISPTADYGLWQINASNGSLATLNPYQNARSAIILSHDGTDWDPWTTYHSGAYSGKC